jgi:hypothetical protein
MFFKKYIFIVLLLASAKFSSAQVTVVADPAIDLLVAKHIRINEEGKGFPGFRVQIFSDSGNGARERANEKRSAFVLKYPDVPAYLDFNNPNFIVRVGDFRTKLEARKFLNSVAVDFPYSFVRKDMIQPPPIE